MELRAGNAGANTVDDHVRILTACMQQIPHSSQGKLVDGAGPPTVCWSISRR
ncbi:hypothetical protein [Streptomyces sp. NPDC048191]|uniref:hypothetical protein n=1 Tax=Streptomyces sp. NPDC048191 TaxID=3155484 RepID=UPI0033CAD803